MKCKNKKGQTILFLLMLAIAIIILILALAPATKNFVDISRNATDGDTIGLDCANSSISDFDAGTCILVDLYNPYFTGIGIALAGAVIAGGIIMRRKLE